VASRRGRTRETETEEGGVKVDDDGSEVDVDMLEEEDGGGVLWVGDEATARSEVGSRRRCAPRPGTRQRHAPRPGLRTAGGDGTTVSNVTEE
jgi:hypothetical protein